MSKDSLTKSIQNAVIDNSDGKALGRRCMLLGNYLSNIILNAISGTYFTGLLLAMGADDFYIGCTTTTITLCGCAQFAAPLLLERFTKRKKLLIICKALYYLLKVGGLGIIPILPLGHGSILTVFMITLIIGNLLNSLSEPGISVWHMQNITADKRDGFFTLLNTGQKVLTAISTFALGKLLDFFEEGQYTIGNISPTVSAMLIIRIFALVLGGIEIYLYTKIGEEAYPGEKNSKINFFLLLKPLKNKIFLLTVFPYLIWSFVAGIIGNYFNIYLINIAEMSYTYMSLANTFSIPVILLCTPLWLKLLERFKWYRILPIAFIGFSISYLSNAFITKNSQSVYFVVMLFCNVFQPCITTIFAYIPYVNMPNSEQTVYFSFCTLVRMLLSFMGNAFGTVFMKITQNVSVDLLGMNMLNYQYINIVQFAFTLSCAIFTYLIVRKLPNKLL